MSAVEFTSHSDPLNFYALWRPTLRHLSAIAWLTSAAIIMFAAFVCTTVRVRDSIFDVLHLQALVIALSSVAASHILMALNIREKGWHVCSWFTVATGWFLIISLT